MKKILSIILVAAFMLTFVASAALAADDTTPYQFTFSAGSASGSTSDFGYSRNYKTKKSTANYIEVRHSVSESAAGYTNLIAAERESDHKYVGSKWMTSNNGSFYKTNGMLRKKCELWAPCGQWQYEIFRESWTFTSVTITGQFRVRLKYAPR